MGFLGLLLKFSFECFDILAWPLIAFVYPLCASIQAIETDSNSDIQKLIAYWVCCSLILLFEHAFLELLLWLPFWTYIKLVIVGYLVTPEFDGSLYVYKHIVHPCLIKDRFFKLKEFFKKDKLLVEVNKDAKETGRNSLENVISSKPEFEESKVVQKDYNAVEIKENKEFGSNDQPKFQEYKVVQKDCNVLEVREKNEFTSNNQPEFQEPKVVQKDYNAIEIKEKNELASTNQPLQIGQFKIALSEKRTCESLDIKEIIAATKTSRNIIKAEPSKNIQKEWACALCQVTTSCEANLISHLHGWRHADACNKLKAKNQSKASLVLSGTDKSPEIKEMSGTKIADSDDSGNSYFKSFLYPWTCALCEVTASSKMDLISHFHGKRHGCALENLENKDETKTSLVNVQNPWSCGLCRVIISTDKSLISHLKGKRHQEACERHKYGKEI